MADGSSTDKFVNQITYLSMGSHLRVIDVAAVLGALQLDTIHTHTHTLKRPWLEQGNEHITSCGGPIYSKRLTAVERL